MYGGVASSGECLTTTNPPVTGTSHTISLGTALAGTKLDDFAASHIEDILGYSNCFAVAALTTLSSTAGLGSGGMYSLTTVFKTKFNALEFILTNQTNLNTNHVWKRVMLI